MEHLYWFPFLVAVTGILEIMYKIFVLKTDRFFLLCGWATHIGIALSVDVWMCNVACVMQSNDVHPYRFRLKTVDRVYRFAVDTSGALLSCY